MMLHMLIFCSLLLPLLSSYSPLIGATLFFIFNVLTVLFLIKLVLLLLLHFLDSFLPPRPRLRKMYGQLLPLPRPRLARLARRHRRARPAAARRVPALPLHTPHTTCTAH